MMKKNIAALLVSLMLISFVPVSRPEKSEGLFLLAALVVVGGLAIWDHNSCWLNWFWGCDGDGGGGAPVVGDPCVSERNICGARGAGTIQDDGTCDAVPPDDGLCVECESDANSCGAVGTGWIVDGVCDAVVPDETSCPPTVTTEFAAVPDRFLESLGEEVELEWEIEYATDCSLSINGVSQVVATSTFTSVPPGFQTPPIVRPATDVTLTCYNNVPTNSASWTIRLMVVPGAVEF